MIYLTSSGPGVSDPQRFAASYLGGLRHVAANFPSGQIALELGPDPGEGDDALSSWRGHTTSFLPVTGSILAGTRRAGQ